ncbi:MAG: ABC transporter ATP-binding protein [Propionibacteriaceae bacterium]|nr:ABC transporter ATP-binding protein [Propionibacteriaceae bacterium]
MTAIHTHALVKRYGRFTAVRGIDLEVPTGTVFGFLGPNGAGKSTTIRVLLDEIRPTSGHAEVLGLDSRRDAVEIHRRLGYLPSDLALYPKLTGAQTLRFFARLRGGVDWRFVEELAERFDADLSKRVGGLSSGNRQKIGLIAALMHRPELLILDEPNTGLDPLVQHEFQRVLREVAEEGRTVFLSSHTLSEVQRVADRVAIIRGGELVAVEDVAGLRALRRVVLLLDGDADAEFFAALSGAHDVAVAGARVTLSFDGELGALLDAVGRRYRIVDLTAHDADLEEVFLAFYEETSEGKAA